MRAGALRVRDGGGLDDLLIDRVVTYGVGHEAVVAVVLCELGRRAGMPVGVVGAGARQSSPDEQRHAVAAGSRAAGPRWLRRRLGTEPEWRCGHQVADTLLDEVEQRCERAGDLARANRGAELRFRCRSTRTASERAGLRCAACARA